MPKVVICFDIDCPNCIPDGNGNCPLDYCPVCGTEMNVAIRKLSGIVVFASACPNGCDIYRPGAKCGIERRRAG